MTQLPLTPIPLSTAPAEAMEALSSKYFAHFIIHLSTGRYALFNHKRQLVAITDDPLAYDLTPAKPAAPTIRPSVADILKDLDL